MRLHVCRFNNTTQYCQGVLFVDHEFACFTLEDTVRSDGVKVYGQTAIPAGFYEIRLRAAGSMHSRYKSTFAWHRGMLELQGVPNFEYVYLHIGNFAKSTNGCILVGLGVEGDSISHSTPAYELIGRRVTEALENGERVSIFVEDWFGGFDPVCEAEEEIDA